MEVTFQYWKTKTLDTISFGRVEDLIDFTEIWKSDN